MISLTIICSTSVRGTEVECCECWIGEMELKGRGKDAMLVMGVIHKLSPKHLDRYVREFAGKHNLRELGTLDQMRQVVRSLVGKTLPYRELTVDNGLSSGARS